jgi:hypothetical protein
MCKSEGLGKAKRLVSWKEQRPLELEPEGTRIDHIAVLGVKQMPFLLEHVQYMLKPVHVSTKYTSHKLSSYQKFSLRLRYEITVNILCTN